MVTTSLSYHTYPYTFQKHVIVSFINEFLDLYSGGAKFTAYACDSYRLIDK